jgi:WD40 repeat protein
VATGETGEPDIFVEPISATVEGISDDGRNVTLGFHKGAWKTRLDWMERYDVTTGKKDTPAWWKEQREKTYFYWNWALRHDEATWDTLRRRFVNRPEWKGGRLWGLNFRIEPNPFANDDYITYRIHVGYGADRHYRTLVEGGWIEDLRTGRPVGFLPGFLSAYPTIAPGGRVAITRDPEDRVAPLNLWDVATGTRLTGLSASPFFDGRFSPDGRFVFGVWSHDNNMHLWWWDATTGRLVQSVRYGWVHVLIDDGRVLVTVPKPADLNELIGPYTVQFWDVATGASLGEWDLDGAVGRTNEFGHLGSAVLGRYLAGVYKSDYYYRPTPWERISDWVNKSAFGWAPEDRTRVVLWDLDRRNLEARLPGVSFAFSPSGKWLATVDKEGIIRTYPVPLQIPWSRILVWTGSTAAAGTILLVLLTHLIRAVWRFPPIRWLRTGRRRWVTIPIAACLFLAAVGLAWYEWAKGRARDEVTAMQKELNYQDHLTEADVTAFIGRPPDPDPSKLPASGWGGTRFENYSFIRRWSRHGSVLDVYFKPDGTLQAVDSSCPKTLVERLADWLEK